MAEAKTRIIHLEAGQDRQQRDNPETRMLVFDAGGAPESFQYFFLRNYEAIRSRCASFGQVGLAVAAVDTFSGRLAGVLCIAAKIGTANSAIIGRHSMADLFLNGDASLSLRHLVVMVSPLEARNADIRFRLVDLRTQAAFQDEHGRRFEALMAEGPLFVRCGSYALFCLPTGDPTSWPEAAADAWACIPERVYLESADAEPDRWRRKRVARPRSERRRRQRRDDVAVFTMDEPVRASTPVGDDIDADADEGNRDHDDDGDLDVAGMRRALGKLPGWSKSARGNQPGDRRGAITLVQSELGPVRAQTRLLDDDEQPLGTLRLRVGDDTHSVLVGADAARRGILLGRYERCDVDGSKLLTNTNISRVHLLVIELGEHLYAIDTASTNGTWLDADETEVRITQLGSGVELCLGNDIAHLCWCPADVS
ncbi:FHA domain-containing protein [Haliangium ochraceum]|uniref:FHA domain-containing protein n=1 Tax=Haliangium ochraceum TaxID=80816 RepID=UPI00019BA487|nr:FHA domain-containing protein [Haliangium ochraceum]